MKACQAYATYLILKLVAASYIAFILERQESYTNNIALVSSSAEHHLIQLAVHNLLLPVQGHVRP